MVMPIQQANSLAQQAVAAPGFPQGLAVAERIKTLPGFQDSNELQTCYARTLLELGARAPTTAAARTFCEHLGAVPVYVKVPFLQQEHLAALCRAAAASTSLPEGVGIAGLITGFSDYAGSEPLQCAHAGALVEVSKRAGSAPEAFEVARVVTAIPGFTTSEQVQFECARALLEAAMRAESVGQVDHHLQCFTTLPALPGSVRLRELRAQVESVRAGLGGASTSGPGRRGHRIASVEFRDQAKTLWVGLEKEPPFALAPDQVVGLFGGRVRQESTRTVTDQARPARGLGRAVGAALGAAPGGTQRTETSVDYSYIVGVQVQGSDEPWYIKADSFNFRKALGPNATYSAQNNLRLFIRRFAFFCPHAAPDAFVRAMVENTTLPNPVGTLEELLEL